MNIEARVNNPAIPRATKRKFDIMPPEVYFADLLNMLTALVDTPRLLFIYRAFKDYQHTNISAFTPCYWRQADNFPSFVPDSLEEVVKLFTLIRAK
jgi:hypothetical protein